MATGRASRFTGRVPDASGPEQERLVRDGREVLRRADAPGSGDMDGRLAAIERLLVEIGDDASPPLRGLAAALLEAKCVLLMRTARRQEQRLALEDLISRFGAARSKLAVSGGWAVTSMISIELDERRFDQATARAEQLQALFEQQPEQQDLTRYGSLLLQASDWLADAGCDEAALRLCDALAERLESSSDARRRVVAAGARLNTSRALAHLERHAEAQTVLEAFVATGETGLAALDQAEARSEAHAGSSADLIRLSLARIAVLVSLDRDNEANVIANRAVEQFKDDPSPFVKQLLAAVKETLDADTTGGNGV